MSPAIAQLVERTTVDRLVTCSNQVGGIYFWNARSKICTFGVVVTYFPSKEVPRFRLPEGAENI
tara:strand:+ start:54 stop:245 length:192 start_codon:yes stop_codon:yes gene_type:complete